MYFENETLVQIVSFDGYKVLYNPYCLPAKGPHLYLLVLQNMK